MAHGNRDRSLTAFTNANSNHKHSLEWREKEDEKQKEVFLINDYFWKFWSLRFPTFTACSDPSSNTSRSSTTLLCSANGVSRGNCNKQVFRKFFFSKNTRNINNKLHMIKEIVNI